jgi:hypothetical protein
MPRKKVGGEGVESKTEPKKSNAGRKKKALTSQIGLAAGRQRNHQT